MKLRKNVLLTMISAIALTVMVTLGAVWIVENSAQSDQPKTSSREVGTITDLRASGQSSAVKQCQSQLHSATSSGMCPATINGITYYVKFTDGLPVSVTD